MSTPLRILVVDDEAPQRGEIVFLLSEIAGVGAVHEAGDAEDALRAIHGSKFDVVLLDIGIPGLNGIELSRVLARFTDPPAMVFVTAHEQYALEAFEVKAVDYLLKPIRRERLESAIRRAADRRSQSPSLVGAAPAVAGLAVASPPAAGLNDQFEMERLPVETAGRTRFVARSDVLLVESCGDYSRLRTSSGQHLVRAALTTLEAAWSRHGFLRVHRSYLVSIEAIEEVTAEAGGYTVRVAGRHVPVSRRHTREFRDRVLRQPVRTSASVRPRDGKSKAV